MKKRNYIPINIYTFEKESDFGDFQNGIYRKGTINKYGYYQHQYKCTDGKWHRMDEHLAKWIYFNGDTPDGYEIDHIIPVSNGGTNKLSNLRLVTHQENNNNPLSKINKSNCKKGEKHHFYGKHLTNEHKEKLSIALKGENNPMYRKERPIGAGVQPKQVFQYDLNGNLISIYNSASEASLKNNFSQGNISSCCRGERKTHKGYLWSYQPL